MTEHQNPEPGQFYSRAELELKLGRLALGLAKLKPTSVKAPRDGAMACFLADCADVIAGTRPAERSNVVSRLSQMAAASHLGIIGLEEWLEQTSADAPQAESWTIPAVVSTGPERTARAAASGSEVA